MWPGLLSGTEATWYGALPKSKLLNSIKYYVSILKSPALQNRVTTYWEWLLPRANLRTMPGNNLRNR